MRRMVPRTTSSKLTRAPVGISPASTTRLSLTRVSAATLERLSWAKIASRIASEIWSATLSGWPSETDSEVKRKLLMFGAVPGRQKRAQRITHVVEPATHSMPIFLRVLAVFPLPILHAMGTVVGWLVYLGSPRFRKHLRGNLEAAGYNDPVIRRSAVAEAGKGAMELPASWMRSQEEAARLVVEVDGWELIERALGAGKGAILLTPHLGCWEITAQYASRRYPITVLYSPPKIQAVEPLMQHGRTREGMKSVPPDLSGIRAMLRALHKGEGIGIPPDQVPGIGEGEWTEFFGRPAYTMTLVTRLAPNTGPP